MDEPPDIRRPNRHESLAGFMRSIRAMTVRKLASSGTEHIGKGEWQQALDMFNEAAILCEEIEDPLQRSNMLSLASLSLYALSRLDEAKETIQEAISLKRTAGVKEGVATDLLGLGEVLIKKGEVQEAEKAFSESYCIFQELGLIDGMDSAQRGLDKVKKLTSSAE
ncbi:MAG: Tetratricopeptide repeat protein [Methanomassiliicoccales archaeon PtaU1.Bin124]|nr:MAG: Tetratricopeptide repeat protein [Methanomassiliicoccales archaeon PtaU1.Bin124]